MRYLNSKNDIFYRVLQKIKCVSNQLSIHTIDITTHSAYIKINDELFSTIQISLFAENNNRHYYIPIVFKNVKLFILKLNRLLRKIEQQLNCHNIKFNYPVGGRNRFILEQIEEFYLKRKMEFKDD